MQNNVQNCISQIVHLYGYNMQTFSKLDAQGLEEYIYSKTNVRISYRKIILLVRNRLQETELSLQEKNTLAQATNAIDWETFVSNQLLGESIQKVRIGKTVLVFAVFLVFIFLLFKVASLFIG